MLIEIFANICTSLTIFMRGDPTEEKVTRNIELLREREWFNDLYSKHEQSIQTDENIRYIIGWGKVVKILRSEKKEERLKGKIMEALFYQSD